MTNSLTRRTSNIRELNLVEHNPILHKLGLCRHILPVSTHKLGFVQHNELLLLGHNLGLAGMPAGRRRRGPLHKRIVAVLGMDHHVTLQLPVLLKLFPARVAHFGQLFGLLRGANLIRQVDSHMHLKIVFPLELGRTLVTHKILVVRMDEHVTAQFGINIETLGTVGTEVAAGDALMRFLMSAEIVEIIGGVAALLAVELANVLVIVDDMLVEHLEICAPELGTVGTAVELLLHSGGQVLQLKVDLVVLLDVGLEVAAVTGVLALPEVLGLAVERQFEAIARRIAAVLACKGFGGAQPRGKNCGNLHQQKNRKFSTKQVIKVITNQGKRFQSELSIFKVFSSKKTFRILIKMSWIHHTANDLQK